MWANKNNNTGFTIVETLIVLAVTGVLFLSTSLLIAGQIGKNRTKDAAINLQSTMQNILKDVSNGYYPDVGYGISCTGAAAFVDTTLSSSKIGTNTACVYAGKKLTFTNTGIQVDTLATADAATMPTSTNQLLVVAPSGSITMTENKPYIWGLSPKSPSTLNRVIYVLNENYDVTITSGKFVSGVQNVGIYKANGTNLVKLLASDPKACFANGSKNSSLIFGGSDSLQISYEVDSTCT